MNPPMIFASRPKNKPDIILTKSRNFTKKANYKIKRSMLSYYFNSPNKNKSK